MVLYYLGACLNLWYSTTCHWLHVYICGTQLSSTWSLPFPLVLLDPFMYLWYSTTFYCSTAYIYGTLLPSTGPLPIPYGTLLPSTGPLSFSMVLYYLLLAPCLSILYSSIFYWLNAYTYDSLLPSTCSLPIHLVLYHLLAHCIYL